MNEHPTDHPTQWDWQHLRSHALAVARNIVGAEEAEDAAQEALIRAWRFRDRCQTPEAPDAWVRSIARREALRLGHSPTPAAAEDNHSSAVTDGGFRSARELDALAALDDLLPIDQLVVKLRYQQDLTTRQIARLVDWPEATVRVRLHRLRRRLAHELKDR